MSFGELQVVDSIPRYAHALYDALDWPVRRQARIERKLPKRHLEEGRRLKSIDLQVRPKLLGIKP